MRIKTICTALLMTSQAMGATPFCASPLKYTCSDSRTSSLGREQKIEQIELELKQTAFKETLKLIDPDIKAELETFEDIDTISPKRKRHRVEKIFYAQLHQAFSRYLIKNKIQNDLGFAMMREALHLAINAETEIPASFKKEMHEKLNDTRLVSFSGNIEESSLSDVHTLYKQCSKKSFVDNAFATELKGEKVIILCPGELIGSIEFSNENKFSNAQKIYPLFMTLGHELSHHFDSRILPLAYEKIARNLKAKETMLGGDLSNYLSEITADIWGLKAARIILSKVNEASLQSKIFAGSLDDLCGTEDDGEHPSGEFRIEELAKTYLCQ